MRRGWRCSRARGGNWCSGTFSVCATVFVLVFAAVFVALAAALDRNVNMTLEREAGNLGGIVRDTTMDRPAPPNAPAPPGAPGGTNRPGGTGLASGPGGPGAPPPSLDGNGPPGSAVLFRIIFAVDGTVVSTSTNAADAGLPYVPGMRAALAHGANYAEIVALDGTPVRVYSRPVLVRRDGPITGVVQIGASLADERRNLRTVAFTLGVGALAGLLLTLGGGVFLAGRALLPIRQAFTRQQVFVADASHELRTPLALIRGNAEALERALDGHPMGTVVATAPEQHAMAGEIVGETTFLARLVDDMLLLAGSDAGQFALDCEVFDLADLAVATVAAMRPQAARQSLTLVCAAPDEATVLVRGDAVRLRQLLLILLDNAIKYTPTGGVTVAVYAADKNAVLTVQDTGPGIPMDSLPHLFERFYRVDKARSREQGGAGLGLAIAREIAAQHGGTVTASNVPGGGARFTVRVPLLALDHEHAYG